MKAKTKKIFRGIGLYFALIVLYCALLFLYVFSAALVIIDVGSLVNAGALSQKEGGLAAILISAIYIVFCKYFIIEMYFDLCFVIIRRKIRHYKYDKPEKIFDILALIFIILTTVLSILSIYLMCREENVHVLSIDLSEFFLSIAIYIGIAYYAVRVITIIYKIVKVIKRRRKKKQELATASISSDNTLSDNLDATQNTVLDNNSDDHTETNLNTN